MRRGRRGRRGLDLAVLAICLAGCGTDETAGGKPFHYPLDDLLRYDHVQVKGTHTSYHLETPGNKQPEWHSSQRPLDEQLDQEGVRQIALEVNTDVELAPCTVYNVWHGDD